MPHIVVEYTNNLTSKADIPGLLKKLNEALIAQGDVFPIGGIRSRAIELTDYCIADGTGENDGFVHVTLKIGGGRTEQVKESVCHQLFHELELHFKPLFETNYLALSLELYEFGNSGTYKKNNIHERYK